jgi:hypothetical protein
MRDRQCEYKCKVVMVQSSSPKVYEDTHVINLHRHRQAYVNLVKSE